MRKLALVAAAFGMFAFAGVARADRDTKTENTEKTDTTHTLSGKTKTTKNHKIERADGSTMEQKVETTRPKPGDRDAVDNARHDVNDNDQVKREEKTTLTGKKEMKTTRKSVAPDGTETDTTTTTTGPDHDRK